MWGGVDWTWEVRTVGKADGREADGREATTTHPQLHNGGNPSYWACWGGHLPAWSDREG